jgi:hypothetical protein
VYTSSTYSAGFPQPSSVFDTENPDTVYVCGISLLLVLSSGGLVLSGLPGVLLTI